MRVMSIRRFIPTALATVAALVASATVALGATATFGSPLTQTPNLTVGCEALPMVDPGNLDSIVMAGSGQASCTWHQLGVFGNQADPRRSGVPGTGRITSVTIRSGANPAPLQVVVMRQFAQPAGAGSTIPGVTCCVFRAQSDVLRPRPNTDTTFALNLPVELFADANPRTPVLVDDLVGITAASNTGTLPIFVDAPRARASLLTVPGSVTAAGFWPAMGQQAGDTGGGRSAHYMSGVGFELLVQFGWCGTPGRTATNSDPEGRTASVQSATLHQAGCESTPGGGGGSTPGGGGSTTPGTGGGGGTAQPVAVRSTLPRQSITQLRSARVIRTTCRADVRATCVARATVTAATARTLGLRVPRGARTVTLGTRKLVVPAGRVKTVAIPLSRTVRTALGRARSSVRITVTTTAGASGRAAGKVTRVLVART